MRIKRNRKARNPNPRSRNAKDGEVDLSVGTYLVATVITADIFCTPRGKEYPSHGSGSLAPRALLSHSGARGTVARPLDGGALSLAGTRMPARGPAAAQPPSSVPPSVAQLSLDLTFAEARERERGKKEKKTGRGDDRRL
jgi:hypothetical protein